MKHWIESFSHRPFVGPSLAGDRVCMNGLTSALLGRACRIFLELAYPGGPETIPAKRRVYLDLTPDQPLEAFLPPAAAATGIGQVLPASGGRSRGYAFRLGSAAFPHLKLQVIDYDNGSALVFTVDTHDAFLPGMNPNHPDAKAWRLLQETNRKLKEQIEHAWEREGFTTFHTLLRGGLEKAGPG
jgi:hypothetical protein